MKLQNSLKFAALLVAAAMLTFAACKKNDSSSSNSGTLTNADDNGGYASDHAMLESTSNSVMTTADNAAANGAANLRLTSGCATVTNDTTVTPHRLTINFGSSPCMGVDGKYRQGAIVVTYTGRYKDSGSIHTITSNNFYEGRTSSTMYKVGVHKTVQNMGTNSLGQVWYNVTVADSIYLAADSIISWTGNRTRTWLSGYSTPSILDDSYAIGGTTTVTRANGHTFTFAIEAASPLHVFVTCPWIESGKIDISGSTISGTYILNYGDTDNCDALATVTIGAHTYDILLR
jgi:hypothetical protein